MNNQHPVQTQYNVLQAMLGIVWGTWFSLSNISVLSASIFRFDKPYLTEATLPYVRIALAIAIVLSLFGVAVLLRIYQDVRETEEKMLRLLKHLLVWIAIVLMVILPFVSIILFKDINPYQIALSGILIAILFWYVDWEKRWISNR
jgi:hypothetical protein